MAAQKNDYDIVNMDDLESDELFGFGGTDSTLQSQSQLPAQNQNSSFKIALTQDDILEPFQNSSGTLDNISNHTSVVNSQTHVPCTQQMDFSISDEHIAGIQTNLEDRNGDLSYFTKYCSQDEDKTDAHPQVEQDWEDLSHIIKNDQNEIVRVKTWQDNQEGLNESVDDSQDPLPVHGVSQVNIQQQKSNVSMTMNTVNQSGGSQFAVDIDSPSILDKQGAISSLSHINLVNSEDDCQFQQVIEINAATNSSVAMEGNMPCQNSTDMLNSKALPNVASALNPNTIHITCSNLAVFPNEASALNPKTPIPCKQNTRTMKAKAKRTGRVGRCPQDVLPLYLEPEPENEEDKKKWRRAKNAREHRESKKNASVSDANTIKDLVKELNEVKTQLTVVTVQRDTLQNTLDNFMKNGPRC